MSSPQILHIDDGGILILGIDPTWYNHDSAIRLRTTVIPFEYRWDRVPKDIISPCVKFDDRDDSTVLAKLDYVKQK